MPQRKRFLLVGLLITFLQYNTSLAQAITVMPEGGFYSDSVSISVENIPNTSLVFYTMDGSVPTQNATAFQNPFAIHQTTVVRFAVFDTQTSDTIYINRSYFVDEETELPVLSISTDPANFFSDTAGIYVEGTNGITGYCRSTPKNWNQDWERPVHFDFFEKDRSNGFSIDAGVKIGGGCTRLYDQKSLDIYFRSEYGEKKLNYHLFEDKPITEFDRLALRSGGQDWYRAMIRNAAIQASVRDRMDLGYQAFKPVTVFLNGEYWGIHMLREKQNEDFIESNYGFDEDELDILTGNANVIEGSADHYNALIDFVSTKDLEDVNNYQWVTEQMDVDQYIDYMITEIYVANGDWPANNIRYWRPQTPDGKWRWIMYDVDMSMGSHSYGEFDSNTLELVGTTDFLYYANPTWATLLFRKLLTNTTFRNHFIQRYSIHLQSTFDASRLLAIMDSTANLIRDEVPRHMDRWENSFRLGSGMDWEKHMDVIEHFIINRQGFARAQLYSMFDLPRAYKLTTLSQPYNGGSIQVETVRSDTADYLVVIDGLPVSISAEPAPGYSFAGWSGGATGTNVETEITISDNTELTAVFTKNDLTDNTAVVINEINYNSADDFDTEDWVEFYNNTDSEIDLGGWYFSDSDDEHQYTFASGTTISAGNYLVLTHDSELFTALFPEVDNYVGDMDFGLSGSGELIRLFDDNGTLIDFLTYSDDEPWPLSADGEGSTLSLTHPNLDNELGTNWAASTSHGTPGAENTDVLLGSEEDDSEELPTQIQLLQNYPNPFNPSTVITYQLNESSSIKLSVFDIMGREIAVLVDGYQMAGSHQVLFNAANLASGSYVYQLSTPNGVITKKMMLLK